MTCTCTQEHRCIKCISDELENRPDVLTRIPQNAAIERVYAEMNMLKPGGFK